MQCNNCIHKTVCSIYRATGGVNKGEHAKEERKGKWEAWKVQNFANPFMDFGHRRLGVFCSVCNKYADNKFDYCPNCGADMRGNENG